MNEDYDTDEIFKKTQLYLIQQKYIKLLKKKKRKL